jgi:hypothetical protein
MNIGIKDFVKAANTGEAMRVDLKAKDKPVYYGKNFLGKVAAWFRGLFNPGTVNKENRAVMTAFVKVLKSRYGDDFADMATERLQVESGKPLMGRKIRGLLQAGEKHKQEYKFLNNYTALLFSEDVIPGEPNCFGSVLADVCGKKGLKLSPDQFKNSILTTLIRDEIGRASDDNKKVISLRQANEIARKEIEKYLDVKMPILKKFDEIKGLKESHKQCIKENILKSGEYDTPGKLESRVMALRFSEYDIHGDPNCFGTVLANVCDDKVIDLSADQFNNSVLTTRIRDKIELASGSNKKMVPLTQAREIARKEIEKCLKEKMPMLNKLDEIKGLDESQKQVMKKNILKNWKVDTPSKLEKLVSAKKELLKKIDTMGLTTSERHIMERLVLANEGIKYPAQLEKLSDMRAAVKDLMSAVTNGKASRVDILNALKAFGEKFDLQFKDLQKKTGEMGKIFGADEMQDFLGQVIQMGLAMKGLDREKMGEMFDRFVSEDIHQMRDAVQLLAYPSIVKNVSQMVGARNMDNAMSQLILYIGDSLGKGGWDLYNFGRVHSQIKEVKQMPKDIDDAFSNAGFSY